MADKETSKPTGILGQIATGIFKRALMGLGGVSIETPPPVTAPAPAQPSQAVIHIQNPDGGIGPSIIQQGDPLQMTHDMAIDPRFPNVSPELMEQTYLFQQVMQMPGLSSGAKSAIATGFYNQHPLLKHSQIKGWLEEGQKVIVAQQERSEAAAQLNINPWHILDTNFRVK